MLAPAMTHAVLSLGRFLSHVHLDFLRHDPRPLHRRSWRRVRCVLEAQQRVLMRLWSGRGQIPASVKQAWLHTHMRKKAMLTTNTSQTREVAFGIKLRLPAALQQQSKNEGFFFVAKALIRMHRRT